MTNLPAVCYRRAMLRVFPRGNTDIAGKGHAEGTGRAVTRALCHLRDRDAGLAKLLHGERHAPGEEVAHRRNAGQLRKALKQRRT